MAIGQPWNQFTGPIATINRDICCTEPELRQKLRKVLSGKMGPVEIAIHDPLAQRVFLSLAVYSPEELLPQGVGSVVGNMRQGSNRRTAMDKPENLGMSLAITTVMNDSHSPIARVLCAAVLSALSKGYNNVSFGTTQPASHRGEQPGSVLIWMRA